MNKLALLALLMVLSLPLMASAQEEAPKVEIFGGYSFLRVSPGQGIDSVTGHGFNLSVASNITKNIGIVSEFARYSKSDALGDVFNDPSLNLINVECQRHNLPFRTTLYCSHRKGGAIFSRPGRRGARQRGGFDRRGDGAGVWLRFRLRAGRRSQRQGA